MFEFILASEFSMTGMGGLSWSFVITFFIETIG